MFSIAGLPFSGVAKNVAKLQTLFETCKPFGQFFSLSLQLQVLDPRRGTSVPESECKVTPFPDSLQIFTQKSFLKICFLT